ncbi:hypothetical protein C1893_31275 [Pseudomonas sp. MPR-ANC1]|nr:hypothetical protein C1893_31275 [Pseudomonas sp. MPR-ANC1]
MTPTIDNVTDSKGPVLQGGITFDRNVTVTGKASPNQKVRLRDGTNKLHEPTANGSGVWTQVVSGLTVKGYSLTALALYGDGPESTPPRTFTVAQAVTPTITNVTDSKGPVVQGGITFDRNVTVTGTASPNQKVRLRDGTNALHEPTANGSGVWTQVVSGLAVKGYSLTALALYGDGPGSTPPRTFTVAQAGAPSIDNVIDSKGPVLQGGITFDRNVTVTGTASPNQKVRLRDGTNALHEPTANGSGVWTQVVSGLAVKGYSLTALALYGDGPGSTPPRTFTVAQAVTPTITNVTDSKGPVANGGITSDRTVTITGTASPNQKVRLLDGSTALHEPTANGSGVWTQVVTSLSVATHSFKAKALYGAGAESAVRTLTVIALLNDFTDFTNSQWNGWTNIHKSWGALTTEAGNSYWRNSGGQLYIGEHVGLKKLFKFKKGKTYEISFAWKSGTPMLPYVPMNLRLLADDVMIQDFRTKSPTDWVAFSALYTYNPVVEADVLIRITNWHSYSYYCTVPVNLDNLRVREL